MKTYILVVPVVILLLAACSQGGETGNPKWVDQLIKQFENQPVGNPPLSLWKYEYNGLEVYYVPAHCCDIPSVVYDLTGNTLCSPDGGIKGGGDGRCDDFFTERSNEQLIWKDTRTR